MRDLAFHYETMRSAHPDDNLMIVFDIDGTIIDNRHMTLPVLKAYDREHGTHYFRNLAADDVTVPPHEVGAILKEFALPAATRDDIAAWCEESFWLLSSMVSSHKPFHGVLDVIRWFQLQQNTTVGINSSRSESLRADTLRILNTLGREYHVRFDSSILHMNSGIGIAKGKADGLRFFQAQGYRIVAVIDSERKNLEAVAEIDPAGEILLLHADIMSGASPSRKGQRAFGTRFYDLTELIGRRHLPRHIEFVWHGVDEEAILRQFLISPVAWAELHVRLDIGSRDLILRRKPYSEQPSAPSEKPARLDDFLYILNEAGRGVKLDLKDPGITGSVIELLKAAGFDDDRIWLTITMEEVGRGSLQFIMESFPGAIRQCPVDSMAGMLTSSPDEARKYLGMLSHAGIDRFSVNWSTPGSRRMIIQLQNWGYDVNIYNVPDLESFLQAALMLPTSLTSFFNFPKWFYTGHSGDADRRIWERQSHPLI